MGVFELDPGEGLLLVGFWSLLVVPFLALSQQVRTPAAAAGLVGLGAYLAYRVAYRAAVAL